MSDAGPGLIALAVLVFLNGFFVAAEFSLVTIRRTRVEQMLAERRPGARNVQDAIVNLDSYIAACQLGITMASLALGWVGEPALAGLVEPFAGRIGGHAASVAFSFIVITVLHVVAGELAPKGVALQYVERTALFVAGPLRIFRAVFRPAIWVLNEGGWAAARLIGVRREATEQPQIGAEELRLVVQASGQSGAIETEEQFLLERVLRFGDLFVTSVMVPRTEVVALAVDTSIEEARATVAEHHYSRYPVYRESIDNVIGVLHVRDLLLAPPDAALESMLRDPLLIPSHVTLDRLLEAMRARRTHFAIAVDEFGGTDGIVTFENVLEAIVGETADEFEEPETVQPLSVTGAIRIDGMQPLDELSALLGVNLESESGQYHTAAGLLLEQIGRIPEPGDSIEVGDYRLTVTEMDELRIASIEATPLRRPLPDPEVDGNLTR